MLCGKITPDIIIMKHVVAASCGEDGSFVSKDREAAQR